MTDDVTAPGRAGRAGGAGTAADGDLEGIGYGAALRELEDILRELEGEAVDIDLLAERVRRAAALLALCRGRIVAARAEIDAAVAELDRGGSAGSG